MAFTAEDIAKHLSPPDSTKPAFISGDGYWRCRCPLHNSEGLSLGLKDGEKGGRRGMVIHCFGPCNDADVAAKLEEMGLLKPRLPCNIVNYAAKLNLQKEFLLECGLTDSKKHNGSIKIPYYDASGREVATRWRIALESSNKFLWTKGDKPCLYGLNQKLTGDTITLVEGESDCLTLWFEGFTALGLPGANMWNEARDAPHLDRFAQIYVAIESDRGGDNVLQWLRKSSIAPRAKLITMPVEFKDPAALYQSAPHEFHDAWEQLCAKAMPWQQHTQRETIERREAAKRKAARLLTTSDILWEACEFCHKHLAVTGEERLVLLAYLVVTSRILNHIVSLIVKGPSAAGKSYIIKQVLKLFPQEAFIARSSMSDKSLIYGDEPLSHRMLVFYEHAGMKSEFLAYVVRSLLSEGCIDYETTEKNSKGVIKSRYIHRDGPTGLIMTTTDIEIHPENETRCLSLTADDSSEQTAAVMKQQAKAQGQTKIPDLSKWHALQTYIALSRTEVVIPFAEQLAELIEPAAVRLRRDFPTLLALIEAHTVLHQEQREHDVHGKIIADIIADYAVVRELVNDLMSEGAGKKISDHIRETREAVAELLDGASEESNVSIKQIAKILKLDRSAASRRVKHAIAVGALRNLEERPKQPAKITLGDEIGKDELLPEIEKLLEAVTKPAQNKL